MTATGPLRRAVGHWRRRQAWRQLPPLRPPTPEPTHPVTIGAILDEFSWSCFAPEARLIELDPMMWRRQVERDPVDLVFVESAWTGNQGRWQYALAHWSEQQPNRLADLLEWADGAGVPTVFWNKEDPVNFDRFIDAAVAFSHVFTTAEEAVDRYREVCGHDRIGVLPFAAQPRVHNPIGRPTRRERVAFAGAWRATKYPHRAAAFDRVLIPALERGALDIFDRYADDPAQRFPDRYRSACLPSLTYDEMTEAYRRYAAFVNVNSVDDSPTMFSRRVFEILACGVPVISTPSAGIDALLGDHVISVRDDGEAREAVAFVIDEPAERDRRALEAYRHVHLHHTYRDRLATVLRAVGLADRVAAEDAVSLVPFGDEPDGAVAARALADRQSQGGVRVTSEDAELERGPADRRPHLASISPGIDYPATHCVDAVLALRYSPESAVGVPVGLPPTWAPFAPIARAHAGTTVARPGADPAASTAFRIHSPPELWRHASE